MVQIQSTGSQEHSKGPKVFLRHLFYLGHYGNWLCVRIRGGGSIQINYLSKSNNFTLKNTQSKKQYTEDITQEYNQENVQALK